ncbi:uncharacterized protein V6R79_019214 [Siganus canaliculatus]
MEYDLFILFLPSFTNALRVCADCLPTSGFQASSLSARCQFSVVKAPPTQRRYCFDRSDEEEEEAEEKEGRSTQGSHYSQYRYTSQVKPDEDDDLPYETTS